MRWFSQPDWVDFMNAKPSRPDDIEDSPPRTIVISTVGWPLIETKLCGCGLPPKLSRLHFVSCEMIETFEACG